jgi:hypothetical protein
LSRVYSRRLPCAFAFFEELSSGSRFVGQSLSDAELPLLTEECLFLAGRSRLTCFLPLSPDFLSLFVDTLLLLLRELLPRSPNLLPLSSCLLQRTLRFKLRFKLRFTPRVPLAYFAPESGDICRRFQGC